jgi:hypothetical protein
MTRRIQKLAALALALVLPGAVLAQAPSPGQPARSMADIAANVDPGPAQDPLPEPLPAAPAPSTGATVLPGFPKPPDLPASLFAPPPPPQKSLFRVNEPYFIPDRLLDDPRLGSPGWFGGVELQVVKPHVINELSGTFQNVPTRANGAPSTVALPTAPLDWTVAPRFFLGYRLPSGFGALTVSERFLNSTGSQHIATANGPGNLSSQLSFNIVDFDYNSRELSLWPNWAMEWFVGARIMSMFYESQLNTSFSAAAAGNGIFQQRQYNNLFGAGPHAALEVARRLTDSGLSLNLRTDFSSVFEDSHVNFSTLSTTPGPNGRPTFGDLARVGSQSAPILYLRAGLAWQPPRFPSSRFFLGYQYERFWSLNRVPPSGPNPPSTGQIWDQGFVLQAIINY